MQAEIQDGVEFAAARTTYVQQVVLGGIYTSPPPASSAHKRNAKGGGYIFLLSKYAGPFPFAIPFATYPEGMNGL